MQRWFYAIEELVCDHPPKVLVREEEEVKADPEEKLRGWRFCVQINDRKLEPNEVLAVSGNCAKLGDWQFDQCVLMSPLIEGCLDKWHVYIDIPVEKVVQYRYLIVAIDPEGDQMIVRFFESHLKPRKVKPETNLIANVCIDEFGVLKEAVKVERGWLTTERIVQLMFFNAPFKWLEAKLNDHIMQVRVTPAHRREIHPCAQNESYVAKPVNLASEINERDEDDIDKSSTKDLKPKMKVPFKCGKPIPSFTKLPLTDCKKMFPKAQNDAKTICPDTEAKVDEVDMTLINKSNTRTALSTAFAFNEVVNLQQKQDTLKRQPTFGTPCGKLDLTLFHLTIGDFANTVYLIEFFSYSKNAVPDEDPYLVGYRYLQPEDLQSASSGYIEAPIMCASTHRFLGRMCFRFLIIRPAENLKFDLSISYLRHWDKKRTTLDVGHRGQGGSYQSPDGKFIYENTIQSMQMAVTNGADMIEFDVHLTKDAVPVVYHDFNVHVSELNPKLLQDFKSIDLPLNKLTYKELRSMRLPKNVRFSPPLGPDGGDADEQQKLFPPLGDIMDAVDEDIAFDIEIKWPQQFCNGKWEEGVKPRFDRNLYIDRILKVVMAKARNRRIVFSCFDADMCSMLRFKQNLFPVMFLLSHEDYMPYLDARSNVCYTGINFAYGMELLGVVPHAHTLTVYPSIIGECLEQNLTIFCYGVVGSDDMTMLRSIGVSAVILDRMDKLGKQDECNCPCSPPPNTIENSLKGSVESASFKSLETWDDF